VLHVYARLELTLGELALYKLLVELGHTLEDLAMDIHSVITSKTGAHLLQQLMAEEYCTMALDNSVEVDLDELREDIAQIFRNLDFICRKLFVNREQLFTIHLVEPHTIALEIHTGNHRG